MSRTRIFLITAFYSLVFLVQAISGAILSGRFRPFEFEHLDTLSFASIIASTGMSILVTYLLLRNKNSDAHTRAMETGAVMIIFSILGLANMSRAFTSQTLGAQVVLMCVFFTCLCTVLVTKRVRNKALEELRTRASTFG